MPVRFGRGPADGRRLTAVLDRFGAARLAALNAGVVLVALGGGLLADRAGTVVQRVGWCLVIAAVSAFVALFVTAVVGGGALLARGLGDGVGRWPAHADRPAAAPGPPPAAGLRRRDVTVLLASALPVA